MCDDKPITVIEGGHTGLPRVLLISKCAWGWGIEGPRRGVTLPVLWMWI